MSKSDLLTLVFDTETTGLIKHPETPDEKQPRIIEWGSLLVNSRGEAVDETEFLVNPKVKLEPRITEITGLTDADLQHQPPFVEFLPVLRDLFERADAILAHNLPFDKGMLELEFARLGITDWPWPARQICTVAEHQADWGRRAKLLELYEHYAGEPLEQTHRALDDVRALVYVAEKSGCLAV